MRFVIGVVEALLALACFGTVLSQLIHGAFGVLNLVTGLVLIALGIWFVQVAVANFKAKPASR